MKLLESTLRSDKFPLEEGSLIESRASEQGRVEDRETSRHLGDEHVPGGLR